MASKIINRKKYDTKKSTLLGRWSNGLGGSNHRWCVEELYKTPNGNYFIFGDGGPASPWAEHLESGGRIEGSDIRALTKDEAYEWAENKLDEDETELLFPEMIKNA